MNKNTIRKRLMAWALSLCMAAGCVSAPASATVRHTGQLIGSLQTGQLLSAPSTLGSGSGAASSESSAASSESGTGATDSTAGTAYGQDTGECTCGNRYINGICSNADCTAPYQEPTLTDGVYQIANAGNLYWFAAKVNSGSTSISAKLTKNIIVNESVLTDGKLPSDTSALKQWTPIGNSSNAYAGTFDGDGHTISGLFRSGSDRYVGLFGYIQGGARIQNVGVIDSCFQASGERAYLGGIVGYAYVYVYTDPITISDCSSAVLLKSTAQSACIGGVVGYVSSDGESVTIQNCFNTGDVTVTSADSYSDAQCGGVAGYVCVYNGSVMIENCSNTGDVTVTSTSGMSYFGGVVGCVYANDASATIRNCFNTGKLTETSTSGILYCGGVVGYAHSYKGNVTIRGCFNTGEITATSTNSYCGGVAGYAYAYADAAGQGTVTLSDCYYLSTVAGNAIGNQVTSGTGGKVTTEKVATKTAEQFKSGEVAYLLNGSTSTGTLVWKQTLGTDATPNFTSTQTVYPYTNCVGTTSYTNDSTQEPGSHAYNNGICVCGEYEEPKLVNGVYEIANAGNLFWFAAKVNGGETSVKAKLTADIDLENRAWTAIGTAEKPYTGTFDGGDFTISNFSLTVAGNNQGLFGAVSGGTVKNFTIRGKIDITATIDISDVSNIQSFSNVGGVVGYATSKALIENITSYVNITDSHTPVTYTDAEGNGQSIRVSGIGGIVGYMDGSTVSRCTYDGTITSVCGASIAGIVGNASSSSTVDLCTNKGNVSAENNSAHIGGIAGDAQTGTTVSRCLNYGSVTSSGGDCIGGIVAYANQNVKIDNCGNLGTVTCTADGDGFIGGILGYINNRSFGGISNCFNYGSIFTDGTAHAGAILGYNRNSGSVYSNNYYLDTSFTKAVSDNAISDVYAMTATQFSSGEIAYKLGSIWKQTLGSDDYPSFTGKDVYYGYLTCKDTQMSYSNTAVSDTPIAHTYGDDGFCTECGASQPCEQNTDGYYEIGNLGQLLWFAEKVNSGETSISAKLTADIDATSVSYIGIGKNESNAFAGTFDGNNKTLKIALVSTEQYVAPFPYINGATIKNLTVSGTIKTTHKFAAGIVGRVQGGNATLENCLSLVAIDSNDYTGGDGTHGGLIGVAAGTTTINNCGFAGSIIGTTTTSCAGIVGWTDSNVITTISNSFVAATFTLQNNNGNTFGRNSSYVKLTNCYYLNALSDASTATQMSAESFASGEVAYKLNGSTNAGIWKQTIGTDSYPNFGGKDVYYGYADCTATTQSYINEPYTTAGHRYDENGFCTRCGGYEEPTSVGGYYEIDNAGKLYWFAAKVNSGNKSINGKLTADITVNPGKFDADGNYAVDGVSATPMAWTPIGNGSYNYEGTFDGNSKSISGLYVSLYVSGENEFIGLFGSVENATIKNVTVADTYFEASITNRYIYVYVGGIVGYARGGVQITNCTSSGTFIAMANGVSAAGNSYPNAYVGGIVGYAYSYDATLNIEHCYNTGKVTATANGNVPYAYVGGIVGYAYSNNNATLNIESCYNTGNVTATANASDSYADAYAGGLVGYGKASNGTLKIENCYNTGDVTAEAHGSSITGTYSGGLVGDAYNLTLRRCYYLDTSAAGAFGTSSKTVTEDVEAKTQAQFKSGEVTWLLNGKSADENVVWKQTLDGKSYPGFTGKIVYYGYLSCEEGTLIGYTNDAKASPTMPDHDYDNGICTVCGKYQPCAQDESGVYLIANAGNLYWFAAKVNGGETSTNAKLTADITVNSNVLTSNGSSNGSSFHPWTPIGSESNKYVGTFDGNNKFISGLYVADASKSYVGLFGYVGEGGTVKSVTIKDSYIEGGSYLGGVAGTNLGTITNCANFGSVTGVGDEDGTAGGIVGNNGGTVTNCYNTGVVIGSHYAGGVVGSNSGTITNCYSNARKVSGGNGTAGGVVGINSGNVTGCYSTVYYVGGLSKKGDVVGDNSGTVTNCYYLNNYGETDDIDGTTAKTEAQFKSGEVTWLLNGGKADGVWKQTLDGNSYPGFTGGTVYSGFEQCKDTRLYTNDSDEASKLVAAPHVYDANGFCTVTEGECHYQPAVLNNNNTPDDTDDDYYEIANAGNLYWFAAQVNNVNTSINGKLTANIVINSGTFAKDGTYTPGKDEAAGTEPRAWIPIGGSNSYYGTFDGDGHTITGLYYNGSEDQRVGMFGNVGNGATVKNVGVVNCYFKVSYSSDSRVGGVVGDNSGTITGCYSTGILTCVGYHHVGGVVGYNTYGTITNCYSTGTVSTGDGNAGGVVGYNHTGTVENCYHQTGTVSSENGAAGGVVGNNDCGEIAGCYNTGTVSGSNVGGVAGSNLGTVTNCYYLTGCAGSGISYGDGEATAMTAAEFTSGKVTWLLNGKRSEGTTDDPLVWKQTLSGTNLPGFTGEIVYGGYFTCDAAGKFSNKAADVTGAKQEPDAHQFGDDGFCTVCGSYQPCEGEGTNDKPYLIANAGNLYWFAAQVNSGKTSIHARLTADITVNKDVLKKDGSLNTGTFRAWTPIGSKDNKFTGLFDGAIYDEYGQHTGNCYTISGLYFNDTSKSYVGLFGYAQGDVWDVDIKDSYFKGAQYVGGVAGWNDRSIIRCSSAATVIGTCYVGGIVGYVDTVEGSPRIDSCTNSGTVTADGTSYYVYAGGIVGYVNVEGYDDRPELLIEGCCNTGKVTATANCASSSAYAGGIMGYAYAGNATLNITRCYNTGNVTATANGNSSEAYAGGLVGRAYSDGTLNITSCYNTGKVTAQTNVDSSTSSSEAYSGGLAGYAYASSGSALPIEGCYNTGNVTAKTSGGSSSTSYAYCGGLVGYAEGNGSNVTLTRCYFLGASEDDAFGRWMDTVTLEVYAKTEAQFKSGEVTWLLNESRSDGIWRQTLGTDESPNFDGLRVCWYVDHQGTERYGNGYDAPEGNHYYDADGFCAIEVSEGTLCGAYQPCELDPYNGVYLIKNVGNLYWFAERVNSGETGANGRLVADITINPGKFDKDGNYTAVKGETVRVWTPIGNEGCSYCGTFDGNGKTISGLYLNDMDAEFVGLFGYVDYVGIVRHVAVKDFYIKASSGVGGIVGYSYYGTVTDCSVSSGTVAGSMSIGGVVGDNDHGTISNCYNTATVIGTCFVGGVAGDDNEGTILNCYYLSGCAKDGNGTVQNGIGCESSGSTKADVDWQTNAKTAADFASGEVTYLLNGGETDGTQIWYQTCGEGYPTFSGKTVYKIEIIGCLGQGGYSNTIESKVVDHSFGSDGFCTVCDGYDRPSGKGTAEDPYIIKNAGQLYWFAEQVNSGDTSVCARLGADITVNRGKFDGNGNYTVDGTAATSRDWMPIGDYENKYIGTFDGTKYDESGENAIGNYIVSGLYFNDGGKDDVGLFGWVGENGVVKNVTVKDSYFQSYQQVGAVVGVNAGTVMNCSVSSVTVIGNGWLGGVVGRNDKTVTNCSVSNAAVSGTGSYVGGVVGKNNKTVTNCSVSSSTVTGSICVGGAVGWNNGEMASCSVSGVTVTGSTMVGGVAGNNAGTLTNCFVSSGSVTGASGVGGVAGLNMGTITNCYNTAAVSGTESTESTDSYVGGVVGNNGNSITNCYYLIGCAKDSNGTEQNGLGNEVKGWTTDDDAGVTTGKTKEQFASGEVTYLLNGERSEGTKEDPLVWFQTIGTDDSPRFTGGTVYRKEGQSGAGDTYTNTSPDAVNVTITWTSMEFTYTDGTWQPESHTYGDGSWSTTGGTVTVQNNGSVAITATFAYVPNEGYTDITGSFGDKSTLTIAAGESDSVTLKLTGKPNGALNGEQLGNILVTIAKAST